MDNDKNPIKLGLLIYSKKSKLIYDCVQRCVSDSIKVIEIDIFGNLEKQGPFDVLIHKVSDLHKIGLDPEDIGKFTQKVIEYSKRHPEMSVINDFDVVKKLTSRKFQFDLLNRCSMRVGGIDIYVPKSLEIKQGSTIEYCHALIKESQIKFPVLAKPMASFTEKDAHKFTLIFNLDNLCDLPVPCMLQEFSNHGGILYKAFVIGDRVVFSERPSIKDMDCAPKKSIVFNSRNISKLNKVFLPELHDSDPNSRCWLASGEKPELLNTDVVNALHRKMSEVTNLKFYGFDMLVDKQGNYALVDLSYFPGFTGVDKQQLSESFEVMIKQCLVK